MLFLASDAIPSISCKQLKVLTGVILNLDGDCKVFVVIFMMVTVMVIMSVTVILIVGDCDGDCDGVGDGDGER